MLDHLLFGMQWFLLCLSSKFLLLLFLSFFWLHIWSSGAISDFSIELDGLSRLLRILSWLLRHNLNSICRNFYEPRRVAWVRHLDILSWLPSVRHHKKCILIRLLTQNTLSRWFLTLPHILSGLCFQLCLFFLEKVHLGASYIFMVLILRLTLWLLTISLILLAVELLDRFWLITKLVWAPHRFLWCVKLKRVTNLPRYDSGIIVVLRRLFGFNKFLFHHFGGFDRLVVNFVFIFETRQRAIAYFITLFLFFRSAWGTGWRGATGGWSATRTVLTRGLVEINRCWLPIPSWVFLRRGLVLR